MPRFESRLPGALTLALVWALQALVSSPAAGALPAPAPPPQPAAPRLEKPRAGQLLAAAFEVTAPTEITVEAVGLMPKLSDEYLVTAWILDAATRRPVWSLDARPRETLAESRFLLRARDRVRLAPGGYLVYLAAGTRPRMQAPFRSFANVLNDLADLMGNEDPTKDLQSYLDRCYVAVAAVDGAANALRSVAPESVAPPAGAPRPLLDLTRAPSDTILSRAFRLARPAALRLLVCTESAGDTSRLLDMAWIEDAATGTPAWLLEAAATRPAGGSRRNRLFDGEVQLPAGDYVVHFVTDGSHAWGDWTVPPPPDPDAWGLAVFAGTGSAPGDLRPLALGAVRRAPGVLATLTMMRDDERRRQEFTLARPTSVRIEALLEGVGGRMADRAWIAEAETGRKIWELDYDATQPAGGAGKNRLFAGDVELPAGRYEAHVRCDDSHAFGHWNAAAPPEPWRWGMTVRVPDK